MVQRRPWRNGDVSAPCSPPSGRLRPSSTGYGAKRNAGLQSRIALRSIRATVLLLAATVATPAQAQPVDLSGKTVTVAIATPSGGGYDLYGRMVARHIGRFLPGNPTVVAQNMPGAGSLIAANWLANVAPKDGTAIAILPSATLFENLLGHGHGGLD